MSLLWFLAAVLQCCLLLGLWFHGRRVARQQRGDGAPPVDQWPMHKGKVKNLPVAAMFIPVAGDHPAIPASLRSLLQQDYPRLLPVCVTATSDDPAVAVIRALREEFPELRHVVAGKAAACGQKNFNTLRGIAAVGAEADIYVFCDSTHTARPDFVRQLIWPVACGETAFSTGYHQVVAEDHSPVTLAYEICVMLMRLLQSAALFTQPWGGAMAMSRPAFERYDIAAFWKDKVVDDCSLAALLLRHRLPVRACPHALLDTPARAHRMDTWRAWMDRQVLFLKFCVPAQWWLLGLLAFVMTLPPVVSAFAVLGGATGVMPARGAWLTLGGAIHLGVLGWAMLGWRELSPRPVAALAWLKGFALASGMFARVYVDSLRADSILWHGIRYFVGKEGAVQRMERE